ncbi:putative membrane protein [Dissostichus eleginoides]|uniref:Membrane protein n=1 Tax=Dissostichus eleginoides TaxID=100907 RepID=A0AAD9CRD3_DISEL|nr:putative membrane protein [Dissostichus eleginoides]
MDNCDLEKLSVSVGKLLPAFTPQVTDYRVTVESNVNKVSLKLITSDCGASYNILCGDGSSTINLNDGLTRVDIEVVAEDGTVKKYCVEITKLSAKIAALSDLALDGDIPRNPAFCNKIYEYNSLVPFHCNAVTLLPKVPDRNIKVAVDQGESSQPVPLNYGDSVVEISVRSADGSNSQVYTLLVTRELIPMAVTFTDGKQQLDYECPVSLTAFYRPISIKHSDPKHIFSRPYIEMLARRSKVDPLSDGPLGDGWKVVEMDLDRKMSDALVKCFFNYRGCVSEMKLSELGSHSLDCPHRPTGELDAKDVTETDWYKKHFASSSCLEIDTKHTLEVRNWEKRLQITEAKTDHLKLYRQRLPKPGDVLQYEDGQSPLYSLEQAAVLHASAIRLSSREARLHFLLGLSLEEQHYATEMYGLRRKADRGRDELSDAKSTARQDDILAVCKLHGFLGRPTVENQLQALDKEYQQLRDQGQSGRADYVQTLYIWLSKKSGKDSSAAVRDEGSGLHRALMKYLDAWSLSPDSWEFSLHTGRLLLLQGRGGEALQHLQSGLALRPLHPALRFFTGLALLHQEQKASKDTEKEAALLLHQGLEHFVRQRCSKSRVEQDPSDPLSSRSTQFLRGLLTLGQLQQKNTLSLQAMSAEQVYHIVAVLSAQSVSQCVCRGEVVVQLEWVLLDAHFALLQRLIQDQAGMERQSLVAKRCQALTALIRLASIAPCQELLDMQERVCQLAVLTTPRDSPALCLLGRAQLAQYDNNPNSERSKEALGDACLSFQASIELEHKTLSGEPLEQLTTPPAPIRGGRAAQPAARAPAARGRAGAAAVPDRSAKPSTSITKPQLPTSSSQQEGQSNTVKAAEEPAVDDTVIVSGPMNRSSHVSRLGLARALTRSADTQERARQLYQEVIAMAPGVHDAYIELVQLLEECDPQAAVEVYCRFPLKPVAEQSFEDAFITGEIVRLLMALELYDHLLLGPSLVAYGKVMGLSCLEKYIDILDEKSMTKLLMSVYAKINDRPQDDQEMLDFFKFKCWI